MRSYQSERLSTIGHRLRGIIGRNMRLMPKRDETLAAFGRNVANFRNERGFSQDKLAEGASLNRTYLSGIERGVRNPGFKVVLKLEAKNTMRTINRGPEIDPPKPRPHNQQKAS